MNNLAIFSRYIGVRTQPYIERHVNELLPGRTVVVTSVAEGKDYGHWLPNGPMLNLGRLHINPVLPFLFSKFGWEIEDDLINAAVSRFLKRNHVKVVLGEFLDRSLCWLKPVREMGVRFFAHAHGIDISTRLKDPYWQTEYLSYRLADGIITISHLSKERLAALGIPAEKIHVIPYGVNIPEYSLRSAKENIYCLSVGRMVNKKSPILTLDAFRRAHDLRPKLRLDYIGGGPLLVAAQHYAIALGINEIVTFHGEQSPEYVKRLMHQSDIYIQHSTTEPETGDEEGLPVSILEAMASSMPIVSTRHAGIPEMVLHNVTGLLVDELDTKKMAEYIVRLSDDEQLRLQLGRESWKRANANYSWETERRELIDVLGLA